MKIAPSKPGTRQRDSLILLKNGQIVDVTNKEEPFRGHPVILEPFTPNINIDLPWSRVGVHTYGGLDYDNVVTFTRADAKGKAMICGDLICTLLTPWFLSKVDD